MLARDQPLTWILGSHEWFMCACSAYMPPESSRLMLIMPRSSKKDSYENQRLVSLSLSGLALEALGLTDVRICWNFLAAMASEGLSVSTMTWWADRHRRSVDSLREGLFSQHVVEIVTTFAVTHNKLTSPTFRSRESPC